MTRISEGTLICLMARYAQATAKHQRQKANILSREMVVVRRKLIRKEIKLERKAKRSA